MTYIVAVAHHAGGVGKTTTTLNLGYELAAAGKRVLLVDLDPQGNLSSWLGFEETDGSALAQALLNGRAATPRSRSFNDIVLEVLPSGLDAMAETEMLLMGRQAREKALRYSLAPLKGRYDFILLDCPPNLSQLTLNAMWAADGVLVPVQAQDKAYFALNLVMRTISEVSRFRTLDNPGDGVELFGVVATMVERNVRSRDIVQRLHSDYGDRAFSSSVPQRDNTRDDVRTQMPVTAREPQSPVALAYRNLAQEVIERVEAYATA